MDLQKYLDMQKNHYETYAAMWSLDNRDHVVGSYDLHNNWPDYDTFLFKDFDTNNLVALEYGCGPGRNIIRFKDKFKQIDGVDIAQTNLDKARINLNHNQITNFDLYVCDGKSIPVNEHSYDVVFSVICLQHIACYDIRLSIFKEIYRSLKPGGYFCFQMGFGEKPGAVSQYYDNSVDATVTNGAHDVVILDENNIKNDLIEKAGFKNYKSDITAPGPGDNHRNWIWVQVQK